MNGSSPPGIRIYQSDRGTRLELGPPALPKATCPVVWGVASVVLILVWLAPGLFGDLGLGVPIFVLAIAILVTAVAVWPRVLIEIGQKTVYVAHRPWRIPRDVTIPLGDIRGVDIDTKEETHRNSEGRTYQSYSFAVQLTRNSTYKDPVVCRTSNEHRAVFLRKFLHDSIKGMRGR